MRKLFLTCLALFSFFAFLPEAQAARKVVAANLTDNFVGVSEGFDGARLTVFGVLKNKADVVVVIEGPPVEAKVRRKNKQLGIWVNGDPEIVGPVPSFYAVVASNPIDKIVSDDLIRQYGLDIDHLAIADTPMGAGYVDVKKAKGLYQYHTQGIQILESNLFRADIFLPPSVPIGLFRAHIYEFSSGTLSAMRDETFNVAQVGLTASISKMARTQPVMYALMALALSLGIGGGAAYAFRRMS